MKKEEKQILSSAFNKKCPVFNQQLMRVYC